MNETFNNLPEKRQSQLMAFDRLLTIMDELREQCPWDKKQTMDSLRHLTIEETYELSDAILEKDLPEIKKEIGRYYATFGILFKNCFRNNDF